MRLAQVHAQRGNLDHEHVFVFVHDQAAQEIAFGVDHAERGGARHVFLPDGQRRAEALLEECRVGDDPIRREQADVDLGAGIVKARAQQTLAVILDLDEVAIADRLREAEHFVAVNPGMTGDNAVGFAGFEQDRRERINDCRHNPSIVAGRDRAGKEISINARDYLLELSQKRVDKDLSL